MKTFLLACCMIMAAAHMLSAQVVVTPATYKSKDTAVNTDTAHATFSSSVPSKVKGIQVSVNRLTGSVGGYLVLQGTIDGNWCDVSTDTLKVTNQAINSKIWPISGTPCYNYRGSFRSTGTQTSTIWISYLRRVDE